MELRKKECWQELFAQAVFEQDHDRFHNLVMEIDRLLQEERRKGRKFAGAE
jgi:hypothetical protein